MPYYKSYPETLKEFITRKLHTIPEDYVQAYHIDLQDDRHKTYYNSFYSVFKCEQCNSSWKTQVASCQIKFRISQDWSRKWRKDKFIVKYDYILYRQKCKKCQKWVSPKMDKGQKIRISQNFAYFIDKVLKSKEITRPKQNPRFQVRHAHNVITCQACLLQKCCVQTYRYREVREDGQQSSRSED